MSDELHVIFGTGPLGHWTAVTLLGMGKRVRMVNRSGKSAAAPAGAELAQGDAYDAASVRQITAGATAVYQCAQPAYHQWEGNFPRLQQSILEGAAAAGARLIVAENLYAYGMPNGRALTEETPYAAHTKKGRIRQAMTESLFAAHQHGEVRVASARGSDFFGPYDQISRQMIFQPALRGKRLTMLGRLDQPHTFTYVADFGKALATLGTSEQGLGRPWHVPSAPPVTQAELATLLGQELGTPVRASGTGVLLLRLVGLVNPAVAESVEMLYEWDRPFVMDSNAFSKTFGITATPLPEAIRASIAWNRSQGAV